MAVAVAVAAALQMWHATKVAASRVGRKSRYNDLTINRCQPPVRGPKSNRSTRGKHRQADSRLSRAADAVARACGHQEQSQYQYQYQYHSWPSACPSCSWPNAASCCHSHNNFSSAAAFFRKMWSSRLLCCSAAVVGVAVVVVVVLQVVTSDQDGAHGSFGIDFELPTPPGCRPRHTRCVQAVCRLFLVVQFLFLLPRVYTL